MRQLDSHAAELALIDADLGQPALARPGGAAADDHPRRRRHRGAVDRGRSARPGVAARTVPVFTSRSLTEGGTRLYPRGVATVTPQYFTSTHSYRSAGVVLGGVRRRWRRRARSMVALWSPSARLAWI